ncbi:dockerin type I domain-containing protein [Paludisphaera borealis]|uniref:Dockerin domain-containing protein n=1 Tax=Paludisphaera borealis TaxID=1387353 RepID=A0A1U7CSM4_9BACT|nr:dockerin type I domain-containing protein [Paludisphaera borealis]APW61908.1 hypothetical protein BSF38_03439 [Paludisphaera borealis]
MMASDLASGVLGALTATVPENARSVSIPFTIAPSDFTFPAGGSRVTLKIEVTDLDGGRISVAGLASTARGASRPTSLRAGSNGLLVTVPAGDFAVRVNARAGDSLQAVVRLAGDVNGDYAVDSQDLQLIASARGSRAGQPGYIAAADLQNNGRIDSTDLLLARRNLGAASSARAVSLSLAINAEQDPEQDREVVDSAVTLVGRAEPGAVVTLVNETSGAAGGKTVAGADGGYAFANVPLALGTNTYQVASVSDLGQKAALTQTFTRVASQGAAMTSTERMAHFNLTNIKGMAYTPEPSDFAPGTPNPPNPYFDSDFFNSYYTPMWSSAQGIQGFTSNGRAVNGRGDLKSMESLGVDFLHIYNWNSQRDHTTFLQTLVADGMTVNVPISNYVFSLPMNGALGNPPYRHQLSYVQEIFNQVYPNWRSGDTKPVAGISMWSIGNEPDNTGGDIMPDAVAKVAQMIVYLEDQANIPDGQRLPITVPLSWATSYGGTSYSNPTPSVGAVEALYAAFNATTDFTASAMNLRNPVSEPYTAVQMTVPKLPSDFFATRFVWANNPVGNDVAGFLGLQQVGYAPYNHPVGANAQIPWSTIPMIFYEVGATSIETDPKNPPKSPETQAATDKKQLADMATARGNGQNLNFYGGAVFQSLDQTTHKVGSESGFGVQAFKRVNSRFSYQTITDASQYVLSFISNTWRLDDITPKPALKVVRDAFKG